MPVGHRRQERRLVGSVPTWALMLVAVLLGTGVGVPALLDGGSGALLASCGVDRPAACQKAVLRAVDAARAREGVRPLRLPADYGALTVPQQLLVLADRERRDRGLPGFTGLSAALDARALAGARADRDPLGPPGTSWGSNWAGGHVSALLADFDWVYDDGPGSSNLECTGVTRAGCWVHRANVLGRYGPRPSMGAAFATVRGRASYTVLFSSAPSGALDYRMPRAAGGPASG